MHVLLIHQAFASPSEPGGTRHYELARYSAAQGHRFTVVTSHLSYLTGERTERSAAQQVVKGLRILRAYTYPSLHRSFLWRAVSFMSFMPTSIWTALRAGPVDVVLGSSPPIFQAVSAWLVAMIRRRPFLLEIRDLWPEFAVDLGVLRNPALIGLSRWLERFLYARATHLVVNSPAYQDYLTGKGVPPAKVSLISNGVDAAVFDPDRSGERIRRAYGLEGKFVVTYAGALGLANDIAIILRTADRLRNLPQIHFLLVGDGKERANLESLAMRLQLPNVTFAGTRAKSEMPDVLAASDACVATLKDIPMFRMTYPNKVFDYMAAGRPTILAIDGVIRQVVEAADAGIWVPPGDDASLAEAVRRLESDRSEGRRMGASARIYVVEHFHRHRHAQAFVGLIESLAQRRPNLYSRCVKRLLDLTLTVPIMVLLSPALALIALLVRLNLGSPVLFRQQRPGLYGKPFCLYKFRTMTDAHNGYGRRLPDAERLTSFGRFLRGTSLDELPELLNVLKGDMSLVGPRPLLMQYLQRYTSEQMRRHDARPGITGWAQVNGRNALTWEQKFGFDVWYVDNQSLPLDLKIIAMTLWKILRREGINQPGQATAEEFKGTINRATS